MLFPSLGAELDSLEPQALSVGKALQQDQNAWL